MTEEKKYPEYFIWILAGVVIVLGVFLGLYFSKTKPTNLFLISQEQTKKAEVDLYFFPSELNLKKSESKTVSLYFKPNKKLVVSGMDIILLYDPKLLTISQSEINKVLPVVIVNKEKQVAGRIGWTYLNDQKQAIWFDQPVKLLSLTIKANALGQGTLKFLSAPELATTVITEDSTARKIPFNSKRLQVVVK